MYFKMMLRFLCCFVALIQTGWAANQYLIDNNYRGTVQTTHHSKQRNAPSTIYKTEYFFFSDPEDKNEQSEALKQLPTYPKKRQQVINFRNPENSAYEKALQNRIQNTVQQKTHIYVLNKEANYAGLQQKFQTIQKNIQHKPEVHTKYGNPSKALNSQPFIAQRYGGAGSTYRVSKHKISVASNNTPVSKNYARNFLPTGVDVVPGSSYIPLVLY